MSRRRILVADDDLTVTKYVQAVLEGGFETLSAMDGIEALQIIARELPDLVILDIMMPKMDGYEVCRRLREWSSIPIIMLSGRLDEVDKVNCLKLGADDYVTKPFGADELIARVEAVLRRIDTATEVPMSVLTINGLRIDFAQRQVSRDGREVNLTPTEYDLLRELVINEGKVLTHDHLLRRVWGNEYSGEKEYLRVFIHRIRAKIEANPAQPKLIITLPTFGYLFKSTV